MAQGLQRAQIILVEEDSTWAFLVGGLAVLRGVGLRKLGRAAAWSPYLGNWRPENSRGRRLLNRVKSVGLLHGPASPG
ncbi:hypothetical protein BH20VER3_BH20VER3_18530 [soil metagenome]